jgi:shikimate dehydrogenase
MSQAIPILGVAGRPVLHSLSPLLFRELFRASGTDGAYARVAAGSAAEAVGLFRSLGMRGMNLTAPFKEEAAALVDELTPDARALGAVNCLVPLPGGRILGANTDLLGVSGALRARGVEVSGRRCLVIGAGGAGKAAARALAVAGGEVVIANRTRARAEAVAALLDCEAAGLGELPALAARAAVIVSTLASDALPPPETWLPAGSAAAILDADYKRGILARYAAERGLVVATGADWLACQALPAFELFMGPSAPPEAARLLAAATAAANSQSAAPRPAANSRMLALVGLMGAGKTQTGRALALLLDRPFVDADDVIEAEAGMAISGIFASEGESGFRARELRALERITSRPESIILATGGGAAAFPPSAAILKERCLCVWLYVSPGTAAARALGGAGAGGRVRPLLARSEGANGEGAEGRLRFLEAERRGAYASCAELLASTEGRTAREAAEVIRDEIDRIS